MTHTGGARAKPPDSLQANTGLQDPAQPRKMCFRSLRIHVSGIQDFRQGLTAAEDRVADLQTSRPPQKIRQVRMFLGMLKFYRRFVPHAATTQASLHTLLAGPNTLFPNPSTGNQNSTDPSTSAKSVCRPPPCSLTRTGPSPLPW